MFLLVSGLGTAQETVSFNQVDSASYVEYMNNDLKKIKETGKVALAEGMDYYYLRMRLGIVGYLHQNYEYALTHFEKAYEMNPADTTTQEYLYYTYLYSGRTENANALASGFSESMQMRIGYKTKRLNSISIGFSDYLNSNVEDNSSKNYIYSGYKRGETELNGRATGQNIMFQTTRNYRLHFYNKLSIYQTNSTGIEQFEIPAQKEIRSYSNNQIQYNWGFSKTTKKEFVWGGGLAFFQTNTSKLDAHPSQLNPATIILEDISDRYTNFLVSAVIGKRMKYYIPSLSLSYSNLYLQKQFQSEFSVTYYPLGNLKLYGTSSYAYLNNNGKNQQVLGQKIGFKLTRSIWFEGKYSIGNHQNYMGNVGFIAFNTLDPIVKNASLDMHLYIKKFELILGYAYQKRIGTYIQYLDPTNKTTRTFDYINNNLTTTLKWNF